MKVTNISGRARDVPAIGQIVEAGESVEVADDIGQSLCEQVDVWSKTPATKSVKASSAGESKED